MCFKEYKNFSHRILECQNWCFNCMFIITITCGLQLAICWIRMLYQNLAHIIVLIQFCVSEYTLPNKEVSHKISFNSWSWAWSFSSAHRYLLEPTTWSQCYEPKNIVEWNVTLFSILLTLGGFEFILCLIQVINGVLGGICGYCCSHQQVRTHMTMLRPSPVVFSCHKRKGRTRHA